jgi:hypothetical protein
LLSGGSFLYFDRFGRRGVRYLRAFRTYHLLVILRMKNLTFTVAMLALLCVSASNVTAQKVRLRSQITPACTSSSSLRFSDIYADGNIAVMGSFNCRGAFIFDISNPDAPVLSNWYNPGSSQRFLEAIVIGNRGYFGSGNGGGVHIVDLTTPTDPQLLGVVNSGSGNGFNSIHEMVVFQQDGIEYLIENLNSTSNNIIKVINITDPSSPVFIRDITPTEVQWVHAMHIRGNRMFTSGWGNGSNRAKTEIYDISDLASLAPALLGTITDPSGSVTAGNNMHSSWTSEDGNYLYSAREVTNSNGPSPGDIRVYNITDPAEPMLVNRITMTDLGLNAVTPHNPVVMGNKLYVSWYQAGLQVFDLTDPAVPKRVGQYDTYTPVFSPDESAARAELDPWDFMCGRDSLQNNLPTNYAGAWAVFPFLGEDRVLVGDLTSGLITVDVSAAGAPSKNLVSDFDGDGITDLSVYTPATGTWQVEESSTSTMQSVQFGIAEDHLVTGDYDGDGRSDHAVWRPSTGIWYVLGSSSGFFAGQFGLNGDVPVPGDYDADGKTDFAVWRPSNGVWYIMQSTLGIRYVQWGTVGDKAFAGDFEGDGKADFAIWRPSDGIWYILKSSSSLPIYSAFGLNGDRPVVADFSGDGQAEITVYRPSTGLWYLLDGATGSLSVLQFGIAEDLPIPADYDGDGKADVAVFRPSTNVWYWLPSSAGGFSARVFGNTGDTPSPTAVQPD